MSKPLKDDSVWTVGLRCSFFKGEVKSVQVLASCGNKKIDAQAVAEMKSKHAPEVAFGTQRHEYWKAMTWTMPKGAPYGEPRLPPKLSAPHTLRGAPFAVVSSMSASAQFGVS